MGTTSGGRTGQSSVVPLPEPAAVAAFWAMMAVVFLAAMDSTVVATVLPAIVADVGGASLLPWVVTGYLLTTAVSIPLWGKAADITSRRQLYVAATAVFLAASVSVAVAPTMPALLAGRVVQGIGTGGLMALTPTLVGDLFPARIRGRFHGRMGAVLAGSSIVGPVVGGVFADTLGWRTAFWINLPLAGLALAIVLRRLHPMAAPTGRRRLDLVGAGLLAAATTALLLALSGGTPLAAEPYRAPLLIGGGVAAAAYLPWQARRDDPVLPLRIFRSPIIAAAIILSFISGAAMLVAIVYAPLYAQTVQGRSAAAAGALLLPLTGAVLIANIAGGALITRLGRYHPFPVAGTLALTVGFAVLATISPSTSTVLFGAALALVGTGLGLTMQPAVLALQNAVDADDLGTATAASTFFRQLGATLAVGILGGLLASRAGSQLAALSHDLNTGPAAVAARADVAAAIADLFLAMTPVAAAAVIVALLLPEKRLSTDTPATSQDTTSDDADDHDDPAPRPSTRLKEPSQWSHPSTVEVLGAAQNPQTFVTQEHRKKETHMTQLLDSTTTRSADPYALRVAIVVGSTRPGRKAEAVARWVLDLAGQRDDSEFELVDIADYELPLLDESVPAAQANGEYEHAHTKVWSDKIRSFDAYIFVAPEYNHSMSGALKNAIDYLYPEWHNKAAGFVSYGVDAAGTRAIEQLRLVMAELQVADVRAHVALSLLSDFDDFTALAPQARRRRELAALLDQLVAWGQALKGLREQVGSR